MSFSEQLGQILPTVNAGINSTCFFLLLYGYALIRRRNIAAHRRVMMSVFYLSALFLLCYLVRFALTGTHRFAGPQPWKGIYLAILFTHMPLAALVPLMAIRAILYARRGLIEQHRRIVRYAYPIWLYVSVTGVIVYAMLYHWPH